MSNSGCPACSGTLGLADSFDLTDGDDPYPLRGFLFECNECGEKVVLGMVVFPDGGTTGITHVDPADDVLCTECRLGAMWELDHTGRASEYLCKNCIMEFYRLALDVSEVLFTMREEP